MISLYSIGFGVSIRDGFPGYGESVVCSLYCQVSCQGTHQRTKEVRCLGSSRCVSRKASCESSSYGSERLLHLLGFLTRQMTGGNTGVILDVGRRSTLLTRAPSLGQLAKAPWRRPLGVPLVSREPTVARHFTGSISQHLRNSSVPAALPISTLEDDTIAAVVTGEIQGAVSIIRLSGSRALQVASRVFRPASKGTWIPESHRVYYGRAYDKNGNILDEVHVIALPALNVYALYSLFVEHDSRDPHFWGARYWLW